MLRKLSAVIFMLVLALVITLKHPVLGYCLCLDAYFTGDCICETATPQVKSAPSDCQGCCSVSAPAEAKKTAPCDDCTKQLTIETGDFVWHGSDKVPSMQNPETPESPTFFIGNDLFASQVAALTSGAIRGDPPPGISPSLPHSLDLPIYLKLSVLRL